ncbi:MAG: hypothetical protein AN485_22935, partial [Anabaena sp. MDT14b]
MPHAGGWPAWARSRFATPAGNFASRKSVYPPQTVTFPADWRASRLGGTSARTEESSQMSEAIGNHANSKRRNVGKKATHTTGDK